MTQLKKYFLSLVLDASSDAVNTWPKPHRVKVHRGFLLIELVMAVFIFVVFVGVVTRLVADMVLAQRRAVSSIQMMSVACCFVEGGAHKHQLDDQTGDYQVLVYKMDQQGGVHLVVPAARVVVQHKTNKHVQPLELLMVDV